MLGMSTEPETLQTITIFIGTAACCFALGLFCGVCIINERYYIWQRDMLDLLHRVNAEKTASLFTDQHGNRPKHLN